MYIYIYEYASRFLALAHAFVGKIMLGPYGYVHMCIHIYECANLKV